MSDRIGWGVRCQLCGSEMKGVHTSAQCQRARERGEERYWYAYLRHRTWRPDEYYRFTDPKARDRWIAVDPGYRNKLRECYVPDLVKSGGVWTPYAALSKRRLPIEGEKWEETRKDAK